MIVVARLPGDVPKGCACCCYQPMLTAFSTDNERTSRCSGRPRMGLEVLSSPSVQWKQWELVVRFVRMFCSQGKCFNCRRPVYGTHVQRCVAACTAQSYSCNDHPKSLMKVQ